MQDHDDLDRAIFALPLAVPPSDLRAAILRSTIYAPVAAVQPVLAFAMRDIVAIGAALAVAVWLVVYAVFDPSAVAHVTSTIGSLVRSLIETQTLAWLAAGAAVALVANSGGRMRLPRTTHRDKA